MSKLSPNLARFINTSLKFANETIDGKINDTSVNNGVDLVFAKLTQTINALSDENPNDIEQIKNAWKGILAEQPSVDLVRNQIQTVSTKIEKPVIKNGIFLVADPMAVTMAALTDTNPENKDQIEAIWTNFVSSPLFIQYLEDNIELILEKVIKNDEYASLIAKFISLLIDRK